MREEIGYKNKIETRKWLPFLWILAAALLAETVLFNFSAWKSLFYKERMVYDRQVIVEGGTETEAGSREYIVGEDGLTLRIAEADQRIHTLFFALEFSGQEAVPYKVSLTDEGNSYAYDLPEQILLPSVRKSYYTNVYPAGRVGELMVRFQVPAGSTVTMTGIGVNARMPFVFSIGRFGMVLLLFLLLYAGKSTFVRTWEWKEGKESKGQLLLTALVLLLLMTGAWKLSHINPICIDAPWPHHKQYQELAEALAEGHFYLDAEPSEGLLQAENPYDTIYLQANGIDYKADYAYHEGRYYVYFGIVPELLLYLPVYLLTGHHLPNYLAVFLFYCGFILGVFALYREVVRHWFKSTPFLVYLLIGSLTVLCGNYLFVIARPDLYDTPIMAANMFTVAGLWLWIRGKYASTQAGRRWGYGLGSLSMALVAGCRPQMLLFSCLAIPLFWEEVIKKRELFCKKKIGDTIIICLPYVFVAAGIMYYNFARFGSPFDFGATYSLTSNDMTKRSFQVHQALLGLWHYFLKPPVLTDDFPFLQGVQIVSGSYMGKLNAEYTYGGMLAGNVFLWVLFWFSGVKESLKKKGIYAFALVSMAISLVISIVDVTGAGILQRYMVDMIWGVWFASVLVLLALTEKAAPSADGWRRFILLLTVIGMLQAVYGFGIVLGNGDLSVNVRTSNPELYYYLKSLFL